MSKNNENKLVPNFRFPEFVNDKEWEEVTLGDVAENVMYGMNAAAVDFDGVNQYIRITDIDEDTRMFSPKPLTSPEGLFEEKYSVKIGDLLFARTGASVGKSYLHRKENGKIYFAGFLIRFTIKNAVPYFIYAQTLTKQYQKWVLATSVRSGQPGINAEEYKSFPILYTTNPKEQQKIADCLSSLDDVITNESQKLEVLKEHKKGLLQNLFPQEGETVPKLRFKEFEDSGEWEEKRLGDFIISLDAGVSVNSGDRSAGENEIGILKTSCVKDGIFNHSENKVVSQVEEQRRVREPVTKDTIIISRMNTPALVGENAFVERDYSTIFLPDRLWAAKSNSNGNMRFISYILSSDKGRLILSELATGTSGSMKNITKSAVLAVVFQTPTLKEQQKIASCLSSLDYFINAQNQKVEALKLHKKGLLQGLFPLSEL